MSLKDIFAVLGGNTESILASLLILMTIVQITPIKINPWSWLAKKFGRTIKNEIVGEVITKVDSLEVKVQNIQKAQDADRAKADEKDAKSARIRILRFGDEVRNQQKHTKEHFDDILQDVSLYEHYCKAHPDFENGRAVLTIEHIREVYKERLQRNDFL